MGFKNKELTEELYDTYLSLVGQVHSLDISQKATLFEKLAEEIYHKLDELRLRSK